MFLTYRLAMVSLAGTLGLLAGCSMEYRLTAKDLKESVEVHLVGVSRGELNQWLEKSMTDYWSPGDPLRTMAERSGIAYRMNFGATQPPVQDSNRDDPVYETWSKRKVQYVLVLAHLPGYGSKDDRRGDQDPRRLVLWLDSGKWPGGWRNRTVDIEVWAAKLTCLREMDP